MTEKLIQIIDPDTGEVIAEHLMYKGQRMTVDGQEIPDPTPMAPPLNYKKQPSMWDLQKDAIRQAKMELARELADAAGAESFEEADDFDVDDDPEIKTQYEVDDTTEVRELARRAREAQSAELSDDESGEAAKPKPKASTAKPKPKKEAEPESEED